jgi:hypothetical protein
MAVDAKDTIPCPACGAEVGYLFSEDDTRYHFCPSHGYVVVLTNGRVKLAAPADDGVIREFLRRVQ